MGERQSLLARGRKILTTASRAAAKAEDQRALPRTHHVFIKHDDERPPTVYTIDLTPTVRGGFLVSCRELPELLISSADEIEALTDAELAIEVVLHQRSYSAVLPY